MVKISRRMKRLASLVSEGAVLADVGTDHGYLPIYLLQAGRIRRAFALDIKEGPLLRAKEHIRAFGLEDYITVRRSDGVAALLAGEACQQRRISALFHPRRRYTGCRIPPLWEPVG